MLLRHRHALVLAEATSSTTMGHGCFTREAVKLWMVRTLCFFDSACCLLLHILDLALDEYLLQVRDTVIDFCLLYGLGLTDGRAWRRVRWWGLCFRRHYCLGLCDRLLSVVLLELDVSYLFSLFERTASIQVSSMSVKRLEFICSLVLVVGVTRLERGVFVSDGVCCGLRNNRRWFFMQLEFSIALIFNCVEGYQIRWGVALTLLEIAFINW